MSAYTSKPLESADEKSRSNPFDDSTSDHDRTGTMPVLTDDAPYPARALDKVSTSTMIDIPAKYRWTALAFIIVYSSGAAFTDISLGPLKSTLLKELKINSKLIYI